jgi:hypothetical protein
VPITTWLWRVETSLHVESLRTKSAYGDWKNRTKQVRCSFCSVEENLELEDNIKVDSKEDSEDYDVTKMIMEWD